MNFKFTVMPNDRYKCQAIFNDQAVSACIINAVDNRWVISSWFTDSEYKNRGIGKQVVKNLLIYLYANLGEPRSIEYIWNGTNQYVYDWIHNRFDAVCTCPLAVQKYQNDDDWSSHIYVLNKSSVLEYFDVDFTSIY